MRGTDIIHYGGKKYSLWNEKCPCYFITNFIAEWYDKYHSTGSSLLSEYKCNFDEKVFKHIKNWSNFDFSDSNTGFWHQIYITQIKATQKKV